MILGIRLMRNGPTTGFWYSKTSIPCNSRITMTTPVVWVVTWKSQISQLQLLPLLLLTFCCCYQQHQLSCGVKIQCYARYSSTIPCDMLGYIQNICSPTFWPESIRGHFVLSDQSAWLHIQGTHLARCIGGRSWHLWLCTMHPTSVNGETTKLGLHIWFTDR
jgi:hypothetical protein